MLNVPHEIYEFNILSYKRSASHKKCRHRKWYQWFFKPHYKNVKRLPKEENPILPCERVGNTEQLTPAIDFPVGAPMLEVSSGSHESIPDHSTPARPNVRKVRIDDIPYEIGHASSESGNDSTIVSTPSTVRAKHGWLENNNQAHRNADTADEEYEDGDTTLLVPNSKDRLLEGSNRDSFISGDDFQSVSSLISDEYAPSVTTASMKSVYYSLPSETSSLIQIWQPEGEACS